MEGKREREKNRRETREGKMQEKENGRIIIRSRKNGRERREGKRL